MISLLGEREAATDPARSAGGDGRPAYGTQPHELARSAVEDMPPPPSALAISFLALATATSAGLAWPETVEIYSGFVWLLPLIPLFLLAYYRGWEGAATVLAATMVALTGVEVVVEPLLGENVDWRLYGSVSVVLGSVTLGTGWLSDSLHTLRFDAYRLAYEDSLTELPSRRALEFFLERQFAEARRGHPFSVVLFDLDEFKQYNDRYGHGPGDDFLRQVARVLMESSRRMNVIGRYGGEEFLAVLPGEEPRDAAAFAERIVEGVREIEPAVGESCTISAGVAGYERGMDAYEEIVEMADTALYDAKERGGDRVRVFDGQRDS